MPTDYGSTARTLSLPILSDRSPSPTFLRPPWNPRRSQSRRARSSSFSNYQSTSLRDKLINEAHKLLRQALHVHGKMTALHRILLFSFLLLGLIMMVLFLVYNEKIFGALKPFAISWKNTAGGWTILWALTFLTAFPPIIGYSTCATLSGFVYGVGEGWLILVSATVVGSTCSFLVSRFVLRSYVERLVAQDKRFAAMSLTLEHDGLKLLCMIRLCPLPYSLSNGGISTFPTVHPLMYALATAIVSPKLLAPVFIGSRLSVIAEQGGQMSLGAKAVNWISIFVTGLVGLFTTGYIYRRTMARARELEAEQQANVRQSADNTGGAAPQFLDDPESYAAGTRLVEGEEDFAFYDDEHEQSRGNKLDVLEDPADVFSQSEEDDDTLDLSKHQTTWR